MFLQSFIQVSSVDAIVDLFVTIWADASHPARVIRTAVRNAAGVMRLKIW